MKQGSVWFDTIWRNMVEVEERVKEKKNLQQKLGCFTTNRGEDDQSTIADSMVNDEELTLPMTRDI